MNTLEDSTELLQYGYAKDFEFVSLTMEQPRMSSWINHPAGYINMPSILKRVADIDESDLLPKSDAKYKFTSIDLILSSDIIVHER